jgi:glucosamine-6-phosphate deaminase
MRGRGRRARYGSTMDVIVTPDHEALSRLAADIVAEEIAERPDAAIVVATGQTPMTTYARLAERRAAAVLDASRVRAVQLDEYLGLERDDRRLLARWMDRAFVDPLGIPHERVVRLAPSPDEPGGCRRYDEAVERGGGIDLAILGLGPNGHLGFNEPPAAPDDPTRAVDLTPESIASNARYWGGADQVPRRALTAGMRVLLAARRTLLLVSGEHKREILRRTLDEPPCSDVPSSFLQLAAAVTVVADSAARPATP